MDHYNQSMGLGLTDQQIVDGINAFAQRSSKQWNEPKPLDASSNPVAVAAESIERALALAGKDSGAFWKVAEPMLSQGQVMADQMEQYTRAITEQKFVADENRKLAKDNGGFGGLIDKFVPAVFSAIAGPVGGLLATAARGAGKEQDFGDILKSIGMSSAGTLIGGGGLDSFTNGTSLGNLMTGAGSAGSISDLLGESTGQGFTPLPGVEQTVTSSLPSSGIGAGLGVFGDSFMNIPGSFDLGSGLAGNTFGTGLDAAGSALSGLGSVPEGALDTLAGPNYTGAAEFNQGLPSPLSYSTMTGAPVADASPMTLAPDNPVVEGSLYENVSTPLKTVSKLMNEAANTPVAKGLSNAKKLYDIYGALTQDPAAPPPSVSGLQQIAQQTQQQRRGRMTRSFGNQGFDAFT